ncbi:MAG: U32 family peptidase [Lachnospiraceae bacterium]|nr:U32 family peptidase [Lachnospiraceae bacterium]
MTELLAPAGNPECLKAAFLAGADAVYLGGRAFGARAYADNFSDEELISAIRLAHLYHKKIYITVNTMLREQETALLPDFLKPFYEEGVDGIIVSDLGVIRLLHDCFPDLPLHASTQMTLTGPLAPGLLKDYGINRIVPARELSFEELSVLKKETGMELEVFIHGAMCYAYSGQCLMSSMLGERSGNRGRCAGCCRLPFHTLADGTPLHSESCVYQLSLKDLCGLEMVGPLMDLGIDSFKIEGRMKSPGYVYFITSMYRKYMDRFYAGADLTVEKEDMALLKKFFNRGDLQSGYFNRHNGRDMVLLDRSGYTGSREDLTQEDLVYQPSDAFPKIPVSGSLYLSEDAPMELVLRISTEDKTFEVTHSGDPVFAAKNKPLLLEEIKSQISKTGNTPYRFDTLSVYTKTKEEKEYTLVTEEVLLPPLFTPLRSLNALRRDGFEKLTDQLLRSQKREYKSSDLADHNDKNLAVLQGKSEQAPPSKGGFAVSLRTMEQLRAFPGSLLDDGGLLCLSYDLIRVKGFLPGIREWAQENLSPEVRIYIRLPIVSRQQVVKEFDSVFTKELTDFADGVICANLEEVAWLQKKDLPLKLISDAGLYLSSPETLITLHEMGIKKHVLPYELTNRQISQLLEGAANAGHDFILPVYGHIPVMVSAGCLRKTNKACLRQESSPSHKAKARESQITLQDRMKKEFPVLIHCDRCENTILNTVPLSLHKEQSVISHMGPVTKLLSFTVEDGDTVSSIADYFIAKECTGQIPPALRNFTRGHFLKGVE